MFQLKILVRKSFGAVNAGAASTVAIEEVSTLDHELSDLRPIRFHSPQDYKQAIFDVQRGEICCLCSPEAVLEDFCSRRCNIDENFLLSLG